MRQKGHEQRESTKHCGEYWGAFAIHGFEALFFPSLNERWYSGMPQPEGDVFGVGSEAYAAEVLPKLLVHPPAASSRSIRAGADLAGVDRLAS